MHLASLIKSQSASPFFSIITLPVLGLHVHDSYQQLSPQPSGKLVDEEANAQGPVELVTVPALGAEWGKDELKNMTKRGRREKDKEDFGQKWRMFNRGQYGLFGRKWLTRRTIVFSLFGLCAAYVVFLSPALNLGQPALSFQHRHCARLHYPSRTEFQHQWTEPSCLSDRLV